MRLVALACLAAATVAAAQDAPPSAPAGQATDRSTGLPAPLTWTFNFDAGWGSFGFANSLYDNPKEPGVDEDLSDQWFEGYVRPALSWRWATPATSELYGTVSAVGERTYGSAPDAFGRDVSSFGPEDLSVGWRFGTSPDVGEHGLDFSVGRSQYRLGHGLLLYDGAAEGGSRGGYWTNARKAFELAAIGRFRARGHTVEGFYLDKDELDEGETGSRLTGVNYELQVGEDSTFGATYMTWFADARVAPERDGLDVFNVRAYSTPIAQAPDLSFEFEYAWERNGDALHSDAWTLQGAYEFSGVGWTPTLTYRYAFFRGDDPQTGRNEAFDPLFPGFHDWGTWWQGEIAGEYFLSNSNLKSHLVRLHLAPGDAVGAGLLVFKFDVDQPGAVGPQVTAADVAFEIDAYTDWRLNSNFTISLVGAFADPGQAVEQSSGRTRNFGYGMVYVAYSY
jgi:hypothetical protein